MANTKRKKVNDDISTQIGMASHYEPQRTASGISYHKYDCAIAHKHWPFGQKFRITNLSNNHSCEGFVIDRGPFNSRIADCTYSTAKKLGFYSNGVAKVKLEKIN